MDDIARLAGVAVGTLYRHFPAKEDLIAAVLEDDMGHLADEAERVLAEAGQGDDLAAQVRALFAGSVARQARDRAFRAAIGALDVPLTDELQSAPPGSSHARVVLSVGLLVETARNAGAVRGDLTLADFLMLLASAPAGGPPEALKRYVQIVLDGMMAR
jgi:AcrR family transcriptional regulator